MSLDLRRVKVERIAKGYSQDYMAEKMGYKTVLLMLRERTEL